MAAKPAANDSVVFLLKPRHSSSAGSAENAGKCHIYSSPQLLSLTCTSGATSFSFFGSLSNKSKSIITPLVWLITGTSSGFGQAYVEAAIAKGDKVIATARGDVSRIEHFKQKGGENVATRSLDVRASQEELDQFVADAVKIYGRIDVLVNNAGYIEGGVVEEFGEELLTKQWKNNVFGPLNLTRAVLGHMRQRRSGTLVFTSSLIAYYADGAPGSHAYSGGKAAIENIVPALALEVAAFNIRCTTVIPGYHRTNVMTPGHIKFSVQNHIPDYAELNKMIEAGCKAADQTQPGDPRKAAKILVDVVHGDGVAKDMPWPSKLPLGADAIGAIRKDCEAKLRVCEVWEKVVAATELD